MTAPDRRLRRRRRLSIRMRLTLAATVVTALVLAGSAVAIVAVQRHTLTVGIDEGLVQRADNLAPLTGDETSLPDDGDRQDTFLQLLMPDGAVAASSSNVEGDPAAVDVQGTTRERFLDAALTSPADDRFRLLVQPLRTPAGPRWLVVGKNLDDVTESVNTLRLSLSVSVPTVVALLAALAWWVTGRVLAPVEDMRAEVAGIGRGQLHRRVPVPDTDDEIADLGRTMNDMLQRVETASVRQERFVDDASHELRTPLTRMIADLEIALASHGDRDATATYRRLLEDATDLRRLTDDLLWLARSSDARPPRTTAVDLDDLALAEARRVRAHASVAVDTTGIGAAQVIGSPSDLARAVRNLVDNAVRFADTTVAFSTATVGAHCELVVEDDGPGVPPHERARIFERFARVDDARSRATADDGGAGLGLAIVAEIASVHGGAVEVDASVTGGARFVMRLPAAPDRPRSDTVDASRRARRAPADR